MMLKSYSTPPSTTPTLASNTDYQNSIVVSVQSTAINNSSSQTLPETTLDKKNQVLVTATALPSTAISPSVVSPSVVSTSISQAIKSSKPSSETVKNAPTPTTLNALKTSATKVIMPIATKVANPTPTKKLSAPTLKVNNSTKASGELQVMYFSSNSSSSTNTITPMFKLINNTASAIKLSEIKIRYYFTVDSNIPQSFWCDWCTAGSSNVYGNFLKLSTSKSNADHYLEIGFSNTSGVISPGKIIEIQTRLSKDNWTDFSQLNDYSFNPSQRYVTSNKITLYTNGKLIYGKEP